MSRMVQVAVGGALVAALAGVVAFVGGSSDSGAGGGSGRAVGTRTCADWAGQMDDGARWDAARVLLVNAKGLDGTKGDRPPRTKDVQDFELWMSQACDQASSDELLATVADGVYEDNAAYFSS
ncbi:hypothetical protein ACH4S8_37310 [Streptomyces sp. NPDC021080]|uniref:hypothetical protein n=1 Tax=Streptomyces sp. NPDC021080 TaxID=3365110 RepID=UPI00379B880B